MTSVVWLRQWVWLRHINDDVSDCDCVSSDDTSSDDISEVWLRHICDDVSDCDDVIFVITSLVMRLRYSGDDISGCDNITLAMMSVGVITSC